MNKIKGLIFDLDGVLVNTKKIHYEALNIALLKVGYNEISYNDHLNINIIIYVVCTYTITK